MANKLKLKKYPYTYARVAAMRGMLLTKEQYHKLVKMQLNSIIKHLEEETTYKKQINMLAVHYSGVDLIEHALNLNLSETTEKLRQISSKELQILIDAYLLFYDISNIKTLLRGKKGGYSADYIRSLLVTAGILKQEYLMSLLGKEKLSEIVKAIRLNGFKLQDAIKSNTEDLSEIENLLDKWYFNQLKKLAETIPKEGELLKNFIKDEISITNIKTLLRLKRAGMSQDTILKFMFHGGRFSSSKLSHLASLNIQDLIAELKETTYGSAFKEGDFIDYELALEKLHIRRNILITHQNPLTVVSILSFMFAKGTEVDNLKTLVKAKQLGIEQEYIENKLLVQA